MYTILDLYCGAGGASAGYYDAGFDVVGVDRFDQYQYPFDFIKSDALAYVAANGWRFDAIHASPPCQSYSNATRLAVGKARKHEALIVQTRYWLQVSGKPYVIENVVGARSELRNPILLCGSQFDGLKVYRHRLFESNIMLMTPPHYPHRDNTPPAGRGRSTKGFISICSGGIIGVGQPERFAAMGIDWMTNDELAQAIPPAYTEFIGRQLIRHLDNQQARPAGNFRLLDMVESETA